MDGAGDSAPGSGTLAPKNEAPVELGRGTPDDARRGAAASAALAAAASLRAPRKGSATPRLLAGLRLVMPERSLGRSTLVGPPRP